MDLNNQIIIYQTEDGQTQVDVRMENETVWLTQAQMAELFETDRTSIVRHINNIYKVGELDRKSTCAKIAHVQLEGKRTVKRNIPYFNLDMIISVGYRVNSKRGVKFRQWATSALPLPCSFGSLTIIITFYIIQMAPSVLQIAPLSP